MFTSGSLPIGMVTYGDGYDLSYTEAEYLCAMDKGILVLPFFIDENLPVVPSMVDKGVKGEKLEDLKRRISKSHTVNLFTTPADLAGKVMFALDEHLPAPAPVPGIPVPPSDPDDSIEAYRQRMVEETCRFLMGLGSKLNEVSLPISDAYVELETQEWLPPRIEKPITRPNASNVSRNASPSPSFFPPPRPAPPSSFSGIPGPGRPP